MRSRAKCREFNGALTGMHMPLMSPEWPLGRRGPYV